MAKENHLDLDSGVVTWAEKSKPECRCKYNGCIDHHAAALEYCSDACSTDAYNFEVLKEDHRCMISE